MDAVTYPDSKVVEFLNSRVVAVRVPHDAKPLSVDFDVKWTPTLVLLDPDGKEHHRTVGFLPPDELIPSLELGTAKSFFDHDQLEDAINVLDDLVGSFGKSDATPEALFLRGVSRFKASHDPKPLKDAYEQLSEKFPASEWTKRAKPYSLL